MIRSGMVGHVHFQLTGRATSLEVAPPAGERATLRRGDIELTWEIERNDQGSEGSDCDVVARTTREVADSLHELLKEELDALDKEAATRPEQPSGGIRFLSDREARWLIEPPEPLVLLCDDVHTELHAEAARLVQILRWLFNRPWPAQPLDNPHFRWSLDGTRWESAPTRPVDLPIFGGGGVELDEAAIELVGRLWESGEVVEPLARQIFLEAVALERENPRAALTLAVTAAEVGVKQFAAAQSSSASEGWLISSIQSPPLVRLIRRYLPYFTDKKANEKGGPAVPRHIWKPLEEAVDLRNDVVHAGENPPSEEALAQIFVAVNDFLYLLDWFAGNEWAFRHLQEQTKLAYGPTG